MPPILTFVRGKIDESHFVDIYHTYWRKLYGIAYQRLSSSHGAEDVVQEVMMSLWRRRADIQVDHLENWLVTATRYAVIRQLAKHGPARIGSMDEHVEGGYEGGADTRVFEKQLRSTIAQLPPRCKLVFEYSRHHGLTNKEIAGALAISEKAVEKQLTKAFHRLRQKMGVVA